MISGALLARFVTYFSRRPIFGINYELFTCCLKEREVNLPIEAIWMFRWLRRAKFRGFRAGLWINGLAEYRLVC